MRRASKVERSMIRKVTQPADCCSQCPVIVGSLGRAAETRQGAKRCENSSIERVNGESSIVASRLEAEDPPSRSKRRKSRGIDRRAILRTTPKRIRSDRILARSLSNAFDSATNETELDEPREEEDRKYALQREGSIGDGTPPSAHGTLIYFSEYAIVIITI